AKEILAYELTKMIHGEEEAQRAKATSHSLFKSGSEDSNMPTTEMSDNQLTDGTIGILDLMVVCGLASSKSEARRLVEQGGVYVDDSKVEGIDCLVTLEQLKDGVKLRRGKKTYHRVLIK